MEEKFNENIDKLKSLTQQQKNELLSEIRKQVEIIDKEIVAQLKKRFEHSKVIGKIKAELNLPYYSTEREKEVFDNLFKNLDLPATKKSLIRIYERILDESRIIQREERNKNTKS